MEGDAKLKVKLTNAMALLDFYYTTVADLWTTAAISMPSRANWSLVAWPFEADPLVIVARGLSVASRHRAS